MLNQDNAATELNYNHAFQFDVIRYREVCDSYTTKQIRNIIDTVWFSLPFHKHFQRKSRKKYREVVKNYVLNLIKSYQTGYFIRVSRNNNDHCYIERYSSIFTSTDIVIKSMDALYDNGWIDLHIGYFDKRRKEGKQTRIFPSPRFIDLIKNIPEKNGRTGIRSIPFIKEDPKETIQLRHKINDKQFRFVPYKD
jgi:hypothetical protein